MHITPHSGFYSSTALNSKICGMGSEILLRLRQEREILALEKHDFVQQCAQIV